MCLILEIVLTIVAWKKGWRWLALLPVCICLVFGLLFGLMLAASGMSQSQLKDMMPVIMIGDVIAIIVLIVMIFKPRTLPPPPKDGSSLGLQ